MVSGKDKNRTSRPQPPSYDAIVEDISNSLENDPVFNRISDLSDVQTKLENQVECSNEIKACYEKVRDLLENLSSMGVEKTHLDDVSQRLLSCKQDVSDMATELKSRMEMQKLSNPRISS